MSKVKRKIKMGPKIIILVIITLVVFAFSLYVSKNYSLKNVAESVTYNASGSFDFNVCYKENNYVSDKCFSDANRAYVNVLIDDIKLNYKYMLNLSQNAELFDYKYKIKAQIVATEKNNKDRILYSETETLFEESKIIENYSFVLIDKKLDVDFQKYNSIITEFKKNYVLSMDSKLIITAELDIMGNHSHLENEIINHRESKMIFTLAEQTVEVETDNLYFVQGDTVVKYETAPIFSKSVILTVLAYLFDILLLGIWFYLLIVFRSYNTSFNGKVNKLLKQYDRAIVKVENLPSFDEYKIIKVASFEELLDVRDNINKPILYKSKNSIAEFVIIGEKEVFMYEFGVYS